MYLFTQETMKRPREKGLAHQCAGEKTSCTILRMCNGQKICFGPDKVMKCGQFPVSMVLW